MTTDARNARRRPIGDLLGDFADDATRLIGQEIELARAEVGQQVDKARQASGLIGVALVLALCGLGALTAAAVLGLAVVLEAWLAALIIGGGLVLLAAIAGVAAKSRLSAVAPPVPERALESVRQDVQAVQEGVQAGREDNGGGQRNGT
jgi:hypothetical protein